MYFSLLMAGFYTVNLPQSILEPHLIIINGVCSPNDLNILKFSLL